MIASFASVRRWGAWWILLGHAQLCSLPSALLIGSATYLFSGGFLVADRF
jgi:hypothetical protein